MKKLILGALLLLSTLGFGQEIHKSEKITSDGWGLFTNVNTTKLDGVVTTKSYSVYGTTTNRFDGTMSVIFNTDTDIFLQDLKQLRDLSTKLEDKESTTIKKLSVYGGGSGKIYIFQSGYAGFVQTNTKQLDKLIDDFTKYLELNK